MNAVTQVDFMWLGPSWAFAVVLQTPSWGFAEFDNPELCILDIFINLF